MSRKTILVVAAIAALGTTSVASLAALTMALAGGFNPLPQATRAQAGCEQAWPYNASCRREGKVRTDTPRGRLVWSDPLALPKPEEPVIAAVAVASTGQPLPQQVAVAAPQQQPVAATVPAPAPQQQQVAALAPQATAQRAQTTGPATLRDCENCPEMVALPGGTFAMGSNDDRAEQPVHQVAVAPVALGRHPVTVGQWRQCVAAKACTYEASGDDNAPVRNVSWDDAQQYVSWLSKVTKKQYRLPTEAEWEYGARANTTTKYWWGDQLVSGKANCKDCGGAYDANQPLKVASLAANPFGLHDVAGGVAQWVSDCWHKDYQDAPKKGSSWDAPGCRAHVLRGGSWKNDASYLRAASRASYDTGVRYPAHGFRVAREVK